MKTKAILVTSIFLGTTSGVLAQNKISNTDPELKIEQKFDDPYKIMWNLGAVAGADGSTTAAALYADLSAFFTMKRFLVRGSHSIDLTSKNYVSVNHPLAERFSKYKNTQVSGYFYIKDEEKELATTPAVGFEEIDRKTDHFAGTLTVKGYLYTTDQKVKIRSTFGVGGSVILSAGNTYSTDKNDGSHITYTNANLNPDQYVLPYSTMTLGFGIQMGKFSAFNYKYNYKNLNPYKFKEKMFRITTLELLLAPSIRYDENIWVQANNQTFLAEVSDVKKVPFGIRTMLTQNFYSGKKRPKKPGFYTNVELGMRPGIYNKMFPESLYFRFGVGFTL